MFDLSQVAAHIKPRDRAAFSSFLEFVGRYVAK